MTCMQTCIGIHKKRAPKLSLQALGKAIVKDSVWMFNAVNKKTRCHLAVMTQEYIESALQDLGMYILWQDINILPGMMHIHLLLRKQTREKFLPACSTVIDPALSIPWTQLSWQLSTNLRTQMSTLGILSLWNMKVHFTLESSSFGTKPVSNSKHNGT